MGIALVHRTTRSVSLTEAGARLYADLAPALAEIETAIEAASDLRDRSRGHLRLAVAPEITTNDLRLMIRLALAGAGVTIAPEECLRPWL